jgi:uncharacterized phiE125 gp8 family phage protein
VAADTLKLVTPPSAEPVTLAELKAFVRVNDEVTDFDGLLAGLGRAARELMEVKTARTFMTSTWRLTLRRFPGWSGPIRLPNPPLQSVTSVVYVADDADGTVTTLDAADYQVDADAEPGAVWPAYDDVWPDVRAVPNAMTVTYVAGYASAALVPDGLKTAIKMIAAHWFEHPEAAMTGSWDELPLAVQSLALANWTGEYA